MIAAYTTELRRLRRATTGKQAATLRRWSCSSSSFWSRRRRRSSLPRTRRRPRPPVATAPRRHDRDRPAGRPVDGPERRARTIARVSLTVPDIADAMVTAPTQLLIHGKQPGTISLFVWDRGGAIKTYEVKVRRDLSALGEQMKQLFPGEPITVVGSGKDVVISGTVSSKYVIEKAADVAGRLRREEGERRQPAEAAGRRRLQPGDAARAFRRSEPQRAAGARRVASSDGYKNDWFGRTTTQQFAAPVFDDGARRPGLQRLPEHVRVQRARTASARVVRALQNKGLFQSLAEPNLIATNGKEASFLAGGEFPIPSCSRAPAATRSRSCSRSSASV